ncbi:uncharacterized protein LOC108474215 [Gossypium arboreum]|uniref:uncharacterized protein LOC108474215 n=1 Tax=Gossypium arboreum TaxID=29729 RepID=UPI0022F189D0|nr:uncharacterized protein LOC108474215 [Gossypium arboreum]
MLNSWTPLILLSCHFKVQSILSTAGFNDKTFLLPSFENQFPSNLFNLGSLAGISLKQRHAHPVLLPSGPLNMHVLLLQMGKEYCCKWLTLRLKGFWSNPRPPDQSQMWNCYYRTLRRNRPPFLP